MLPADSRVGEVASAGARARRRRRAWSEAEKKQIVEETLRPGASVSIVARRHDLNANLLFTWRRQLRKGDAAGETAGFVPAVIAGIASAPARRNAESVGAAGASASEMAGRIEIVLAGGARVIVDNDVSSAALARVIGVLERR